MSHQFVCRLLLLPLVAVAAMSGCTSSESAAPVTANKNTEDSRRSISNDDSLLTIGPAAEKWVATLDHGHGPGNGYELIVRDGRVSEGKFYLLDPDKPHDLAGSGQTVAFEEIKASDTEIVFSITLQSRLKEYREWLTITFAERLAGNVGEKVLATAQTKQPDAVPQDLEFVRRE